MLPMGLEVRFSKAINRAGERVMRLGDPDIRVVRLISERYWGNIGEGGPLGDLPWIGDIEGEENPEKSELFSLWKRRGELQKDLTFKLHSAQLVSTGTAFSSERLVREITRSEFVSI